MKLVAEFLNHAKECLSMSSKANNEKIQDELEQLAQQWTIRGHAEAAMTHSSLTIIAIVSSLRPFV